MTLEEMKALEASRTRKGKPKKDEEHRLQTRMVHWFRLQFREMSHALFAVPNGGRRDAISGARLKAEGVTAGVSDLILLKSNRFYGALLIEVKTKIGRQSKEQKEWQAKVTQDNYKYVVVRSLEDFIREVKMYMADI